MKEQLLLAATMKKRTNCSHKQELKTSQWHLHSTLAGTKCKGLSVELFLRSQIRVRDAAKFGISLFWLASWLLQKGACTAPSYQFNKRVYLWSNHGSILNSFQFLNPWTIKKHVTYWKPHKLGPDRNIYRSQRTASRYSPSAHPYV